MDAWLDLFGRTHPLLVHLPIGIIFLLAALELWNQLQRRQNPSLQPLADGSVRHFILICFALSAIVSALFGWFLATQSKYGTDLLFNHRWTGVGVAVLGVWLCFVHRRLRLYYASLVITVVTVCVTGHFGGSLTHGRGYLGDALRAAFSPRDKRVAGPSDLAAADYVIYDVLIQPTTEARCVSCHGEEKSKGGLRLDSFEFMMAGGDSGPSVVPGQIESSLVLERIWLPLEDDDHMPPEGKPQMTDEELEVLEWWIETGASPDATLAEIEPPDDVEAAIRLLLSAEVPVSPPQ